MRTGVYLLLALLLGGCGPSAPEHDVYIWQRIWTPALHDAIVAAAPLIQTFHVLALEIDGAGAPHAADIRPQWLQATARPIVLVIRLNGRLDDDRLADPRQQIVQAVRHWQQSGLAVQGVEIDYDCATARLPGYAQLLQQLRADLPASLHLAATALPAWLDSPDLEALIASVDSLTLQVHSVLNPRQGLFDPGRAAQWVVDFDRRTDKPFRIALPAYGSRVRFAAGDRIDAIDSEMPATLRDGHGEELRVDPRSVAGFIDDLPALHHLQRLIWFRLPGADDRRAWRFRTWAAVLSGTPLRDRIEATAVANAVGGFDIRLTNSGDIDRALPETIRLAATRDCESADGLAPYRAIKNREGWSLRRTPFRDDHLRVDDTRIVGWIRCPHQEMTIDVDLP